MIFPVPLGPWMPDAADFQNGGLVVAKNVYPSPAGYHPFWSATAGSETVTGTVLGARQFTRTDGTEIHVVGTSSDLYVIVSGTSNASSLALSSINSEENWAFEQFGAAIYATIKSIDSDSLTYYIADIDTDTTFSTAPGTPPSGNALARIDDFLVYGDLEDIDASDAPYRIRWSAYNDPAGTTWGTEISKQMGFVDLPQHLGIVTGIAGGEVGLVMQKLGTSRFDYTGTAAVFNRVKLSGTEDQGVGCEGHASIVTIGGMHYWLSNVGFVKSNGFEAAIISKGKVWDWFLKTVNTTKLHKVQASINHDRRCVVWNCYQVDTTAYNMQMIYNWELDAWSYSFVTVDWLVPTVYTGSFSEGDPRFRRVLGGFISGTWQEFTGTALEATLETGEFQLTPGRRSFVSGVRVISENETAGEVQVSVKYRNTPGATKTATTATAEHVIIGYTPVNVDARFFSIEVTQPAGTAWDKASALEVDAIRSGIN